MIAFNATPELRATFEKLIKTMNVQVKWNGMFVVIDNTLILQGEVRSLFFHFDSRKVITNIIDLEIPAQAIVLIEKNDYVRNSVNMLLYAFGKWGNIAGLKVEKDYKQLSQLFSNILGEIGVETEYNKEHFLFFQKGVRIVYEDVIQCALEAREDEPEEIEEDNEAGGLWHKLIWKQKFADFAVSETSVRERNRNRLGSNFYLSSYLCPECQTKMHSVVYPVGKEFVIETEEGGVRIARAYTCGECASFYTPRPRRLLIDGDCYIMDFMGDKKAYDDYKELLGKNGGKVCNYNYNEYVNRKNPPMTASVAKQEWDETLEKMNELSPREFERFFAKVAEGYFPEESVEKIERKLWKKREEKPQRNIGKPEKEIQQEKEYQEKVSRYKARIDLFPRLSERQRLELSKQIAADSMITEGEKKEFLSTLKQLAHKERYENLKEKVANAKNKNALVMFRVYDEIEQANLAEDKKAELLLMTGVKREVYEEYVREHQNNRAVKDIGKNISSTSEGVYRHATGKEVKKITVRVAGKKPKTDFNLKGWTKTKKSRAMKHLQQRVATSNKNARSAEAVRFKQKSSEQGTISKKNGLAESVELEKRIQQANTSDRKELQQILDSLYENKDFEPSVIETYEEKLIEQIRHLDEAYLDEIMGDLLFMSSEEGVAAYEQIMEADLLPELKTDALKQLKRRLEKLKSEECELLVQKLKKQMKEAKIEEPARHHYNPAERIYKKETTPEETEVMEFAMASYGAKRGYFEYPILTVDTSWNRSGDKGMFLTPEYLYYSTLLTAYRISVFSIERVEAMTGLLNKGLYVYQKNGEKTKIPYAVETSYLPEFAEVLDGFVKYLQEKPFSRKETYLAREKHEEICCFRCGYVYRDLAECPKCGYKANQ